MIHELSIVLIYATFAVILINFYTKRVDKLEDRIIDLEDIIIDLEEEMDDIKDSLYIADSKKGKKNG